MAAVDEIKKDLIDNEHKIDYDITAKHEKDFMDKIKIWHQNEMRKKDFEE